MLRVVPGGGESQRLSLARAGLIATPGPPTLSISPLHAVRQLRCLGGFLFRIRQANLARPAPQDNFWGILKNYSDTDAAAGAAAGAAAAVFFILGVAWAQGPQAATPRMNKTEKQIGLRTFDAAEKTN